MIYLILCLLSLVLTYLIKNYAIKKSLVDIPNSRSSHTTPTPHGGGIAIAITWFIGIFYLYLNNSIEANLFYALLIGIAISVVSYFDDLYELNTKLRIIVQSITAILGFIILGGLSSINLFLFTIDNQIITSIFAFLLIIWFINLYNFLDGIDGYAGTEAVFLASAGFVLFGGQHFLVLASSVLGFLFWNWHRAKIFMGDVGSTLLGYNIAIFTIYYANEQSSNLWVWVVLFGLFWFDATLTLIRRFLNKEQLTKAHRKHAYQRITDVWSHSKTVIYSMGVNIILFSLVYFIDNLFISFILSIILLYITMKFVDNNSKFK